MKKQMNKAKIVPIQKRFQTDYEFIIGDKKLLKTCITKIAYKRGKYHVFDDPNFDL